MGDRHPQSLISGGAVCTQQQHSLGYHPYNPQGRTLHSWNDANEFVPVRGRDISTLMGANESIYPGRLYSSSIGNMLTPSFRGQDRAFGPEDGVGRPESPSAHGSPGSMIRPLSSHSSYLASPSAIGVFSVDDIVTSVGLASAERPKLDHFRSVSALITILLHHSSY